jgi:HEAT repeat protein
MVSSIRLVGRAEQRAVVEFARRHEESILDAALTALLKERRIAGRRLLVELLSSLSAASTAQMVSRARNAPWYFIRNIVTILGRRRERTSVPVLEALLDHPHEKVRREVLRSLGRMGGPGRRIIVRFAGDATRNRRERLFAKGVLDRMGSR